MRDLLLTYFGGEEISENIRPEWLIDESGSRMELDFLIPRLSVAIEVQGGQHYKHITFFHKNKEQYDLSQKRDRMKVLICAERGIKLIHVSDKYEALEAIETITSIVPSDVEYVPPQRAKRLKSIQREIIRGKITRIKNLLLANRTGEASRHINRLLQKCVKYGIPLTDLEFYGASPQLLHYGDPVGFRVKPKKTVPPKLQPRRIGKSNRNTDCSDIL